MVPRPQSFLPGAGRFTLPPSTTPSAPTEIGALIRELLGPVGGIDMRLDPAADLGDEGYRLSISDSGARAVAPTLTGLRWAVQAIRQLVESNELPYCEITDRPAYAWRGLLIDVARWYQPISWLREVVDLLALHRMNVLHLHLTDDQGWRFEVKRYPRLTEVGAWRRESPLGHEDDKRGDGTPHGGFYTQHELRDLVAYAQRRGVTIVPEIDVPGHSLAAIAAYPELGNSPAIAHEVGTRWGIEKRVLNCAPSTVGFYRDVLDELLEVFPSHHIHLGGDEVPTTEWEQAGLSNPDNRVGWWIGHLTEHLSSSGRQAVVWDLGQEAPSDAVVMAWRGQHEVDAAIAAGREVIATPESHLYFDYNESLDPGEPIGFPGRHTSLAKTYGYRLAGYPEVLGVQACLWGEYLPTPQRSAYNLLPRLCAVAEIAWGTVTDHPDFCARLTGHLARPDHVHDTPRRPIYLH